MIIDKASRRKVYDPESCIYLLFDGDDVVYVGQSIKGAESRIYNKHCQNKRFDSYVALPHPKENLDKLEVDFIIHYKPKYNLKLSGNEQFKTKKEIIKIIGLFHGNNKMIRKCFYENPPVFLDYYDIDLILKTLDDIRRGKMFKVERS